MSFFYRTISTPKPELVSYQYEGMTVIKKSKTTPWAVTYNYFVKVGGKDEVEEFIFNQGQSDFTARTITTGRLAQKETASDRENLTGAETFKKSRSGLVRIRQNYQMSF
ncbi:Hypothetical predicted protein [Mytilus galloprovincialis]|uniref:Uncharacterized protein n=1 Tax=Mytilus galloprovincialis TaxID=29158 RepID=A0A8B6F6Y2_MYTGA|nr:Hypothetical predicted protein [Mytilus galloprovincialis]